MCIVSFPHLVYLDLSRGIFLSHTHLVPRSPTHIVPSWSRGDLSITNTPSLPSLASIFSIRLSRPLSLVCQTSLGHVLGVSLSPLQTTTQYLRVYPHLAFSLGDACVIFFHKTHTHFLSNLSCVVPLSFTHTLSFCTLTLSPSHTLDLSLVMYSLWSIAYIHLLKSQTSQSLTRYVEKTIYI